MPSKNVAWIEGETLAQDLINTLSHEISTAVLPDGVENRWQQVFETPYDTWVTYTQTTNAHVQGKYLHSNGKLYNVYKMRDNTNLKNPSGTSLVDADGLIWETTGTTNTKTGVSYPTKTISYANADGQTVTLNIPGLLVAIVDDPNDAGDLPSGTEAVVLEQGKFELDGSFTPDPNWNEYRYVCDMPGTLNSLLLKPAMQTTVNYDSYYDKYTYLIAADLYTFTERAYVADPVHYVEQTVVLKATPDVPEGQTALDYFVMFKAPKQQYNSFDVYYGNGFVGTNAVGDSKASWQNACDPATVLPGQVPTIISMKQAEEIYLNGASLYTPPTMTWALDEDGKTEIKSPPAHFFYGADSVLPWLTNKKRRADYWVSYFLSVNNDRVAVVLEGDPSPDMDSYYRSFGYIGTTVPFNDTDHDGNFGVTVGMGDLDTAKTGLVLNDIKQDTNKAYSGFGRYTSNGMYSFSMLRTRSRVMFQAYYPAFITQLPNYTGVGTIPAGLSTLELEKHGFQPSAWTDKYHASPIYLVHQYEGYRGYLEGVVAINDHNLINKDELVVDTEEPKDPNDLTKGTWTEVYKFLSLKSPVNFFKSSANPDECTIAILKEVY